MGLDRHPLIPYDKRMNEPPAQAHLFEEVLGVVAAQQILRAHDEGRTWDDHPFSAVPISDPGYITHTASSIFILHFIWLPIVGALCIPVLLLGTLPFLGICAVAHLINHTLFIIVGVVSVFLYWKYVCWRLVICRILGGLFKHLF